MATKHTPSPWLTVDRSGEYAIVQSLGNAPDSRNGGKVCAMCPGPDGDANARLIAAAPDMLAVLHIADSAILGAAARKLDVVGAGPGYANLMQAHEHIARVIAKAEA